MKSKNEMKQDLEKCKRMFREFKSSIHTINDKLTAIQGATENIWEEIDKKNFYITQQIETIIRSVDTVSLHVENMEKAISEREVEPTYEFPATENGKKKILLAEDDYDTCNILKLFLEKANMDVATAANGRVALEFFEKDKFDLIITDINMPEVNGSELYKIIREQDTEVPVLFISGYDKEVAKSLAENDERAYYLNKPFKHIEIINVLEQAML